MSLAMKYAMKKRMARGGKASDESFEKGVHHPKREGYGRSEAGNLARSDENSGAKGEHYRVLGELRSMKSPLSDPKAYASGGEVACNDHGLQMCEMCHGGKMMADGGVAEPSDKMKQLADSVKNAFNSAVGSGSAAAAATPTPTSTPPSEKEQETADAMKKAFHYAHGDIVERAMKKYMSKGGMVANEEEIIPDFEDNKFDDLGLRDDLEFSDTGANSGDEHGDDQEDKDRRDIVSRIMKSRAKKDRMPRPA